MVKKINTGIKQTILITAAIIALITLVSPGNMIEFVLTGSWK